MNKSAEQKPAPVPKAKQAGDTPPQWEWVEPKIWTERMLAALEKGVKGGKWFSLIDKVFSYSNLCRGFQRVKQNQGSSGTDKQSISEVEKNLALEMEKLSTELREGRYQPRLIRRHFIPKPGRAQDAPFT